MANYDDPDESLQDDGELVILKSVMDDGEEFLEESFYGLFVLFREVEQVFQPLHKNRGNLIKFSLRERTHSVIRRGLQPAGHRYSGDFVFFGRKCRRNRPAVPFVYPPRNGSSSVRWFAKSATR